MMSGVQGGNFWVGFASGCLASVASSAFQGGSSFDAKGNAIAGSGWGGAGKFADSTVGLLTFGTVSGGAGASLTGGNFWQGAVTGLVVSGLNHAVHGGFAKKHKLHVMHDFEGANGAGHQALVGDVDSDLLYISKDGTNENDGIYGDHKSTIKRFSSFSEINDYYTKNVSPGKLYDKILTYKVTQKQLQMAMNTAISTIKMDYNLFFNSCITIVRYSLVKAGILNTANYNMIPNMAFKAMSKQLYKPAY
ncbi:MAG: hypothetical protein M0D53_16840 [Flavobacterium sp. JAD_PAG50586_2]|nr:MAG: hypothetical protein M0D53_16840 [Flavobacterium sp. JAD_PAG50586_2]